MNQQAERQQTINLAEGKASAVRAAAQAAMDRSLLQAKAKAESTRIVARALEEEAQHGETAVRLALASEYVRAFGKLAESSSTLVVPADASSVPSMIRQAMAALGHSGGPGGLAPNEQLDGDAAASDEAAESAEDA